MSVSARFVWGLSRDCTTTGLEVDAGILADARMPGGSEVVGGPTCTRDMGLASGPWPVDLLRTLGRLLEPGGAEDSVGQACRR